MAKPYIAIVTIPKLKAVVTRCLQFNCWTWDVVRCDLREVTGCLDCSYCKKVVAKIEDIFREP